MIVNSERTLHPAKHKILSDGDDGRRYAFYCDLSGMLVYTTKPIRADTPEEELSAAWKEAMYSFNYCPKCHRNVCDTMFNVDVSECVDCSPWVKPPAFCSVCGTKLKEENNYCVKCGKAIQKEGVDEDAENGPV